MAQQWEDVTKEELLALFSEAVKLADEYKELVDKQKLLLDKLFEASKPKTFQVVTWKDDRED